MERLRAASRDMWSALSCPLLNWKLSPRPGGNVTRYWLPLNVVTFFPSRLPTGARWLKLATWQRSDQRPDFPLFPLPLSLSIDSLPSNGPPIFSPAFPLAERPTPYLPGQRLTGDRNTRSNPQNRMDSGTTMDPALNSIPYG
jgi:hypothetical protein